MPSTICKTCGKHTNSTTSNYWNKSKNKDIGEVTQCYMAWDDEQDKWVEGCAYDKLKIRKLSNSYREWIDSIITEKASYKPPNTEEG